MEKKKLVLTGIEGFCEGSVFSIWEGKSRIMGRSRMCDFSLRKMKSWMEASEEDREAADEFKSVSRRHCKIEVTRKDDKIVVKVSDTSRNGTFIDEEKIGPVCELKDWEETHYMRLGEIEKFRMEIADLGEDEKEDVQQPVGGEDQEDEDEEEGKGKQKKEEGEEEKEEEKDKEGEGSGEEAKEEKEDAGEAKSEEKGSKKTKAKRKKRKKGKK